MPPSVQKHMRIVEYDRGNEAFLLSDGKSYLAAYEIRGFPTEGRDDKALQQYALKMQQLIDTFPRSKLGDSPFVVQCYVSDEPNLFNWYERVKTYADDNAKGTRLNDIYIKMAKGHMRYLCREGGIFTDQLNGNQFKGGERITRLVFYRKCPAKGEHKELREFKRLCKSIETKLDNFKRQGMDYRKYDDKAMFYWLFNTFNKSVDHFEEVSDYLDQFPYEQNIENRPYGYHFMELAFSSGMKADSKTKTWRIGNTYHKHIACLGLRKVAPKLGAVTAERKVSEGVMEAFFDSMPEGATMHLTFVCQSEVECTNIIENKVKAAGKSTKIDAAMLIEESRHFLHEIQKKNYLFPTQIGCYIAAESAAQLDDREQDARSKLLAGGFEVLACEYDPYALDKFLRFLPGNYNHSFDHHYYSSRLLSLEHISRLMPIGYARNKGTGKPLICDYNRVAEPVTFDPFKDRSNNPHLLMLGTTGSGKSVRAANMMLSVMAMYKPYLTITDAGGTFEFLVEFFERAGLSVNKYVIQKPKEGHRPDFSLNPFFEVNNLVTQVLEMERLQDLTTVMMKEAQAVEEEIASQDDGDELKKLFDPNVNSDDEPSDNEDMQRDYIAEFQLAALLMCCDGKEPEEVGITTAHKNELLAALIECAKAVVKSGRDQMLPEDLKNTLFAKAKRLQSSEHHWERQEADRLRELAKKLEGFLKSGVNGMYFNCPAKPIKKADITYFEMGLWKDDKEPNEAPRALAFIVMMNRTMAQAEARQHQGDSRFSLFFGDECHIVTTKKVTAASLTQCAKMSRKVGLYLWFATQNVSDFNGNAAKMLSMFEFWICLEMSLKEFKQVTEFIEITELEQKLFATVSNQKGAYTEGVILSKNHKLLIRCVPFRELLFLALNEKDEKTKRAKIAKEYNCSMLEAAFVQAQLAKGKEVDLGEIRALLAA